MELSIRLVFFLLSLDPHESLNIDMKMIVQ